MDYGLFALLSLVYVVVNSLPKLFLDIVKKDYQLMDDNKFLKYTAKIMYLKFKFFGVDLKNKFPTQKDLNHFRMMVFASYAIITFILVLLT